MDVDEHLPAFTPELHVPFFFSHVIQMSPVGKQTDRQIDRHRNTKRLKQQDKDHRHQLIILIPPTR